MCEWITASGRAKGGGSGGMPLFHTKILDCVERVVGSLVISGSGMSEGSLGVYVASQFPLSAIS